MAGDTPLPHLCTTDVRECGYAFGTICAELLFSRRCTSNLINAGLVTLVEQMTKGQDTRQDIRLHLDGRFQRLVMAAECLATDNEYLQTHLDAIKRPFNIT